jgi:hypothetical protein
VKSAHALTAQERGHGTLLSNVQQADVPVYCHQPKRFARTGCNSKETTESSKASTQSWLNLETLPDSKPLLALPISAIHCIAWQSAHKRVEGAAKVINLY